MPWVWEFTFMTSPFNFCSEHKGICNLINASNFWGKIYNSLQQGNFFHLFSHKGLYSVPGNYIDNCLLKKWADWPGISQFLRSEKWGKPPSVVSTTPPSPNAVSATQGNSVSAHLPLSRVALHLSDSSHFDSFLQQSDKQLKEKSCDTQGNYHFYTKATSGYLSTGLHWKGLGIFAHPCSCTMEAPAYFSRKLSKIMQTFICKHEAFFALLNLSSTVLLINRIMCFRTHMASFCVCLVSCTYHWPIPVVWVLHLAAYGMNFSYLLKPCVSY